MRTLYNGSKAQLALVSVARTSGTAVGTGIDLGLGGNNSGDVMFVVLTTAIIDGTHAITVEESDVVGSGYAAVESHRILGSQPVLDASADNKVYAFGCRPTKRFVRISAVSTSAPGANVFGVVAIQGNNSNYPFTS